MKILQFTMVTVIQVDLVLMVMDMAKASGK